MRPRIRRDKTYRAAISSVSMTDKPGDPPGGKATRAHKDVDTEQDEHKRREFMHAMLADLRALDRMLREGRFDTGPRRIGAEQEMFLIDRQWAPARASLQMLEKLRDPHYTTELGQFQLEANADPQLFTGDGLSRMERQIDELVGKARAAAAELGLAPVLMGILPTLRKSDLGLDGMVPSPRYRALNKAIADMRGGGGFQFSINGTDELIVRHDSVMLEACNASFQVHLQVSPAEFARMYNIAQLLAAPMVAIAANSPLLFGRRLWAETRVPLFEQVADTRTEELKNQAVRQRVWFGERWITSIFDLFEENVRYFPALLPVCDPEDPDDVVAAGGVPRLPELRLHNGTVYRWNRPVYDVRDGVPHLRVENRVLSSGPTVVDMLANAAFYFGLTRVFAEADRPVWSQLPYGAAELNFYLGCREGLGATLFWPRNGEMRAGDLVLERLLPAAYEGLDRFRVEPAVRDRLLGIIEQRCLTGRNGAVWQTETVAALEEKGRDRMAALREMVTRYVDLMHTNEPVHTWPML